MIELELKAEIHCTRPNWALDPKNQYYLHPAYRLYIDSDLLTERTWYYTENEKIEETIWVCIHPDGEYTIKLEPLLKNPAQADFDLVNFRVTNKNYVSNRVNNRELTFRLQ